MRDLRRRPTIVILAGKACVQLHRARSATLFGDTELQPVRGQLAILMPQPEVRYAFAGGSGYMFPRPDGIILGGTFERDVWDPTPDPSDIARIVRSHQRFFEGFRCTA